MEVPASPIPTFHPTEEEMTDLSGYIRQKMVEPWTRNGKTLPYNIVKISPPEEWKQKILGPDDLSEKFWDTRVTPLKQEFNLKYQDKPGFYTLNSNPGDEMSLRQFRELATDVPDGHLDTYYWQTIVPGGLGPRQYVVDLEDEEVSKGSVFDLNDVPSLMKYVSRSFEVAGVHWKYVYIGQLGTTFAIHLEDEKLPSLNFLRWGAHKRWNTVPVEELPRLLTFIADAYPEQSSACPGFLAHKVCLVSTEELHANKFTVQSINQGPGEFILTFPNGIHWGYNTGFNCAEARNIAPDWWLPYAGQIVECTCLEKDKVGFNIPSKYLRKMIEAASRTVVTRAGLPSSIGTRVQEEPAQPRDKCEGCIAEITDGKRRGITRNVICCGKCSMISIERRICYDCGKVIRNTDRRRKLVDFPEGTPENKRFLHNNCHTKRFHPRNKNK